MVVYYYPLCPPKIHNIPTGALRIRYATLRYALGGFGHLIFRGHRGQIRITIGNNERTRLPYQQKDGGNEGAVGQPTGRPSGGVATRRWLDE